MSKFRVFFFHTVDVFICRNLTKIALEFVNGKIVLEFVTRFFKILKIMKKESRAMWFNLKEL